MSDLSIHSPKETERDTGVNSTFSFDTKNNVEIERKPVKTDEKINDGREPRHEAIISGPHYGRLPTKDPHLEISNISPQIDISPKATGTIFSFDTKNINFQRGKRRKVKPVEKGNARIDIDAVFRRTGISVKLSGKFILNLGFILKLRDVDIGCLILENY